MSPNLFIAEISKKVYYNRMFSALRNTFAGRAEQAPVNMTGLDHSPDRQDQECFTCRSGQHGYPYEGFSRRPDAT